MEEKAEDGQVDALVRDLARLAREAPADLSARVASLPLRDQAELALRLPARERLELLLHAPQPMRLVRSLPDAEVYLTVREIGPSDALPLLALASADQIQHLIDLEAWRLDRFDAERAGAWVALLLESGEPTVLRFLRKADDELLALLFGRWARVRQIESDDTPSIHGHGETEAGTDEGFLSPDGNHRFSPTIEEHGLALGHIAQVFFQNEPQRYERVLWAAIWELPSDLEEQALHWRQSRLEEHGFPTWEEALSVYAPPEGKREPEPEPEASAPEPEALTAPRGALRAAGGNSPLARAVDLLEPAARERFLLELTAVANRLLVADGSDTGDTAAHRAALDAAGAYVAIALAARRPASEAEAARLLREVPAIELFRESFARAAELAAQARRFVREGWPALHPRALEMLDDPILARLHGLLGKRPLYLDASGKTPTYRAFHSLEELEETRVSLELAELLGRILTGTLGWELEALLDPDQDHPARLSALFVTSLAWHDAESELRGAPLPEERADAFRSKASEPGQAEALLDRFLERLAREASLAKRATAQLRAYGRASLARVTEDARALLRELR